MLVGVRSPARRAVPWRPTSNGPDTAAAAGGPRARGTGHRGRERPTPGGVARADGTPPAAPGVGRARAASSGHGTPAGPGPVVAGHEGSRPGGVEAGPGPGRRRPGRAEAG